MSADWNSGNPLADLAKLNKDMRDDTGIKPPISPGEALYLDVQQLRMLGFPPEQIKAYIKHIHQLLKS